MIFCIVMILPSTAYTYIAYILLEFYVSECARCQSVCMLPSSHRMLENWIYVKVF